MQEKQSSFCKRKPHTGERFLEVCLLVLLSKEQGHGYSLLDQTTRFGFSQEEVNGSTLYRTLRKMENDEWVSSLWEAGLQGPKRRIYCITDNGRKELEDWIVILKSRKERIEKLIINYEEINT